MKALRYLAEIEHERDSEDNGIRTQNDDAGTLIIMFAVKLAYTVFH
jgi:hypothetical protein